MKKTCFLGLLVILLTFIFISCNNEDNFISTINETVSNNTDTLGIIGTSIYSSHTNIATAKIESEKIKITSVAEGRSAI